jgi:hypothetical protein
MTLTMKTGAFYRTANGRKEGPAEMWNRSADAPRWAVGNLPWLYYDDGRRASSAPESEDLVAEWVDPCPLGQHVRGDDDNCTVCGATPDQVNEQAKATMPVLQIEAGKFYRTRGGLMVGPAERLSESEAYWPFVWRLPLGGRTLTYLYDEKGTFGDERDTAFDLVAEWPEERNEHMADAMAYAMLTPGVDFAAALTEERKTTHGDWSDQAVVGVMLDDAVQDSVGYAALAPFQRKAVDMILVKISRIVSGDPAHEDHWADIAGYAHLGKSGHKSS